MPPAHRAQAPVTCSFQFTPDGEPGPGPEVRA
jgi:hypothetical protein